MPRFIDDSEIESALAWLTSNASAAAKARAERSYVEDYAKVLRARIMKEHPKLSAAKQEAEAYADSRYLQHLEAIRQAINEDAKCTFLREAALAKINAWQSMSANERTKI